MDPWHSPLTLVFYFAGLLFGLTIATNYRGVTSWYVRRSRSRLDWRRPDGPDAGAEKSVAFWTRVGRAVGIFVIMANAAYLITGLFYL